MPSIERFHSLHEFLDFDDGCNVSQYNANNKDDKCNCPSTDHDYLKTKQTSKKMCLPYREQLFLTLCCLKQGFRQEHLSTLFKISQSTVSRYFVSMINYMYLRLGAVNI